MNLLSGQVGGGKVKLDLSRGKRDHWRGVLRHPARPSGTFAVGHHRLHHRPANVVERSGTAMFVRSKSGEITVHALSSDCTPIKSGDIIGLRSKPGLSHLFDAKTQQRIA